MLNEARPKKSVMPDCIFIKTNLQKQKADL